MSIDAATQRSGFCVERNRQGNTDALQAALFAQMNLDFYCTGQPSA